MSDENWDDYYRKLDPMGKQFMDLVFNINKESRELYYFTQERGQLYGALLYLMELTQVDKFEMFLDDFKAERKRMLFFIPNEDKTGLLIESRAHEYSDLQEPASDTSDEG